MNRDHTHRPSLTVILSLTLKQVTVNIGDKGVRVRDNSVRVPNNGVCVCDVATNIKNVRVCVDCEFGLEVNSWR